MPRSWTVDALAASIALLFVCAAEFVSATATPGGIATASPTLAGAPAQTPGSQTTAIIWVGIAAAILGSVSLCVCMFLKWRSYDKSTGEHAYEEGLT